MYLLDHKTSENAFNYFLYYFSNNKSVYLGGKSDAIN